MVLGWIPTSVKSFYCRSIDGTTLFSNIVSNKLWGNVKNEITLICAKFGVDLINTSKVTNKVAPFFCVPLYNVYTSTVAICRFDAANLYLYMAALWAGPVRRLNWSLNWNERCCCIFLKRDYQYVDPFSIVPGRLDSCQEFPGTRRRCRRPKTTWLSNDHVVDRTWIGTTASEDQQQIKRGERSFILRPTVGSNERRANTDYREQGCRIWSCFRPPLGLPLSSDGHVTWRGHVVVLSLQICVVCWQRSIYASAAYKQLLPSGARRRCMDGRNVRSAISPPLHRRGLRCIISIRRHSDNPQAVL